ncbi:cysteine--tRNA ligase 2 cytoplasmic [Citrus sinensis]|nr:cysteine--tRNA ligase 2 cytoplasmic [Citrus sinensis]
MYVCGVTAYVLSLRMKLNLDQLMWEYLKHLKYEVTYVRNFTDIDDKIIHQANELGEDSLSLSKRYCEEYLNDMGDLQCRLPTKQPCVSGHMKHITDMITWFIINNGCAYVVEGDVFFYVEKSPNYGQLSRQRLENNRAGERVAVDPRKRNPADFALWKAAKPGEKSWDSPWGQGRPGWHIECSAMSARYLTFKFDIHGGGIDLIFPHHENEIAQNRAACQESCVRYWMHNGHVTINNEKMSKSSGNFLTIRQITERYHPLTLRHFLISAHYRSLLHYSVMQLESASDSIFYIYQTLLDCEVALFDVFQEDDGEKDRISAPAQLCFKNLQDEFYARMSDDLNTSHLLTGAFQDALKFINSHLNMLKNQQLVMIRSLRKIENKIKEVLKVLGLLPRSGFSQSRTGGAVEADVLFMIEKRTARKNKDFSMTDQIRADLSTRGIALMDVGNETFWRPCVPVCNPTAL